MNVLVTGGCGFIGSHYIKLISEKYPNDLIVCLDALTYAGNIDNIKGLLDINKVIFIYGNICDEKLVEKVFDEYDFDYVVNFAAESHVDRSFNEEDLFMKSNYEGVRVLLEASRRHKVKRFHQVSTDEVYGSLEKNENRLFKEDDELNPANPYSKTKALADILTLEYAKKYNLDITISRSSNNYGPNQYNEKLIPVLINNAVKEKPLPIYGDGLNIRDWIYVKDNCIAIDLILRNGKQNQIYNISGDTLLTNIDVARIILHKLNKSESLISFVKDRPINDYKYHMDSSKIKKELNWKNITTFEDGIKKTIEFYCKLI